jgi:hypothetical protein
MGLVGAVEIPAGSVNDRRPDASATNPALGNVQGIGNEAKREKHNSDANNGYNSDVEAR